MHVIATSQYTGKDAVYTEPSMALDAQSPFYATTTTGTTYLASINSPPCMSSQPPPLCNDSNRHKETTGYHRLHGKNNEAALPPKNESARTNSYLQPELIESRKERKKIADTLDRLSSALETLHEDLR
ncbi:hypothetical protein MMC13_007687 [Lambiella insularis]|nr:hypothetical protein [Lambiella insularis]